MPKKKRSLEYEYVLDRLKEEIANEMGIEAGAMTSSRLNGKLGATMVKRLTIIAEIILMEDKWKEW